MKLQALSPQQVEQIDLVSRQVLEKVGVLVASEEGLEILASAGAGVDFDEKKVWIPGELLDQALSTVPNSFKLWTRDGNQAIELQDGVIRGHNVGGCIRILDPETLTPREATRQDLRNATVLIDALENIHVCRPVVYPEEFPSSVRDIHVAATMLQYTTKPYGVSAYSVANQTYIMQIAGTVAGGLDEFLAKPFIWGSVCPASPLFYDESTTNILIRYAKYGMPVAIAPCPLSGGTSPVTLAGTLVQQNAEFLAGLVLVQIIKPGNPVKYTTRPIPMDMRTATSTFGAMELGMMSSAIVHLAESYGVCSDVYGLGTSAKTLDEQAAYEKALNGLLPALAGADLVASAGMLEDALTSSFEQLVIDNDILGMIFRAVRGIEISDETLAFDVISGVGPSGNYLMEAHTLKHSRSEYYYSALGYRKGLSDWVKSDYKTVLDAARSKARVILNEHEPDLLDEGIAEAVVKITQEADRELGAA